MSASDPTLQRLEHDHLHIAKLVEALRETLQAAIRGEHDVTSLHAELEEFLSLAQEEIFEHFQREEEALFPFVMEHFPDTADTIRGLERAHDHICGVTSRMMHIADTGPEGTAQQLDALLSLFARFDAYFSRHAKEEGKLLEFLRFNLGDQERARLALILEDIG